MKSMERNREEMDGLMTAGSRAVSNAALWRQRQRHHPKPNSSLEERDILSLFLVLLFPIFFDFGTGAELVKPFIHISPFQSLGRRYR